MFGGTYLSSIANAIKQAEIEGIEHECMASFSMLPSKGIKSQIDGQSWLSLEVCTNARRTGRGSSEQLALIEAI